MSKAPSMPMYWDAYLADTTHLTTEEHGAYMLLLAAMWRRDGSVPDDDKDNARILGLTVAKWKRTKQRLSMFLICDGDTITQKNLQKIWKNTQEKIAINKVNGAKGGRAAASKNNDLGQANAANSQERKATIPEPEPEPLIREEPKGSLSSDDDPRVAFDAYNDVAESVGWPVAKVLTQKRRSALRARLKEAGGVDGWLVALEKARASPLCTGQNDRNWIADLDFLLQQKSFTRLMEGSYDARQITNGQSKPSRADFDTAHREYARRVGAGEIDFGPDPSDPFAGG